MKNLKKDNKGFTIIEVLIVLAIAGLIMLIVFLAVPALQRNARNTGKRSDVSKALGAVGEYSANNGGAVPVTGSTVISALSSLANLSSSTTINGTIPTTTGTVVAPTISEIEIGTGLVCDPAAVHVTSAAPVVADYKQEVKAGPSRSVVAIYTVESSNGNNTTQCTAS